MRGIADEGLTLPKRWKINNVDAPKIGEEITLNYAAPFSGPMCFFVQDTLISMRKELAQLVPITDPNVKSFRND